MFFLLRPNNLFILVTYLTLSVIPFASLFFGKPVRNAYQILGMECVAWLAVWAIFKRPAWFHWLLIPAFLALPTELYLRTFYGQGISAHHLGIIAETSPKEAVEFLGKKIWLLLIIVLGTIAWWHLSWRAARRTRDLDWSDGSRWFALIVLIFGLCTWLYGQEYGVTLTSASITTGSKSAIVANSDAASDADEEEDAPAGSAPIAKNLKRQESPPTPQFPPLPSWAKIPFEFNSFGDTWPFGLVVRAYDFGKERIYLSKLKESSNNFKFGTHQTAASPPQILVMVIGESSRYDRWSLNGYARETNPLLKTESNLVSLSNVITSVSATRLSVPVMVSRKPATQSLKAGFAEKSVLSAFKEAGFKTYWLSNQMSFGKFDTPVSVFANEADVTQFLNLGGFTNNSNFDEILLQPLLNAMADPAPKKLIVLHTLGNHWNYSHRHPKEFDKWTPSLYGVESPAYTNLKIKTQLSNSYDNSILYTDWFLSQVIQSLKLSKQLTSLIYISDHGQTLYDGSCDLAFHGHNTQFEFHVPSFVWTSDLYRASYPGKIKQLIRNKNAKLSTENIFHSMLDMADIRYATEQPERSFMNIKLKRQKRYVDSYGWTDYDNATIKGDCREVIDKGKPLVQEK